MTIQGSCLCGRVRFELSRTVGPFEICHCNRCRKLSGAAGLPAIGVHADDYRLLSGSDAWESYAAPILSEPPPYHAYFCRTCGSPLPPPDPTGWFEIPAGLLDGDPGLKPDKHIFVEFVPPWDEISDGLPRYTLPDLVFERHGTRLPEGYRTPAHYDRIEDVPEG